MPGLRGWKARRLRCDGRREFVDIPETRLGRRVHTLVAGNALGENALEPSGRSRRTASIVAAGAVEAAGERQDRQEGSAVFDTLLLAIYRADVDQRSDGDNAASAAIEAADAKEQQQQQQQAQEGGDLGGETPEDEAAAAAAAAAKAIRPERKSRESLRSSLCISKEEALKFIEENEKVGTAQARRESVSEAKSRVGGMC